LNGFLIALDHIYQANRIFNLTELKGVFDRGVVSAAANLYKYDLPVNWTLYHLDTPPKLAPPVYHDIHTRYCQYLYDYTNVTIFKTYADKWASYDSKPPFLIEEILTWEYVYFGLIVAGLVLIPTMIVDAVQYTVRKRKHESFGGES
ncbi:MAG: D-glucuronyl C5-epimerase family protein, partial [Candidatus Hodarchaeota archaeon]